MNAMLMALLLGATTAPTAGLDDAQFARLIVQPLFCKWVLEGWGYAVALGR